MKAIITDITDYHLPNVCIAALAGDRQIRLHEPKPLEQVVRAMHGLDRGSVIELKWTPSEALNPPHVEDGWWNNQTASNEGHLSDEELIAELEPSSFDSVREAFGEPVVFGKRGNCAFTPNAGQRSLATVRVESVHVSLEMGKVRVDFADSELTWKHAPLQDFGVNVHLRDCAECKRNATAQLRAEFERGPALLRVGLTRPTALGDYPLACWLQVNHIVPRRPTANRHFVI